MLCGHEEDPMRGRFCSRRRGLERIAGLILVVSTLGAYWHLRHCDFTFFDDPGYVFLNPSVIAGLNRVNVVWAFTTFSAANWHPLTWLSHMLDCSLYGLNPAGHHLTSLFFHVGNVLLLFLFLREATNQTWRSFIVAALFSLHPLHVESVAWIAERKDVLSTFCWMLALVAYGGYARRSGAPRYLLVLFLFALGLMAKPMLVTFPFVLILMDYWPLQRLSSLKTGSEPGFEEEDISAALIPMSRLIWEKIPFVILSAASSIVTVIAQSGGRAVMTLEYLGFAARVSNALVSYVRYILFMLWPKDLAVFYPHPCNTLNPWLVLASALLLAGLTVAVIYQASRRPYLVVGWLWYLGTLVPVIGLVQVGNQALADRYTYIPLVGLFIAMVWGLSDLFAHCRVRRIFTISLVCAVFLALILTTRSQLRYWENTNTLFGHTLKVTEDNYLAHFLLAQVAKMEGDLDTAAFHKSKALEFNPLYVAKFHNRWGYYLAELGSPEDAIAEFSEAIQIYPDYANAHNNLGVMLARKERFDEAIEHFTVALRISPNDPNIHESLRNAQIERERVRRSVSH
jgi:protein O-mannosyl-transferase